MDPQSPKIFVAPAEDPASPKPPTSKTHLSGYFTGILSGEKKFKVFLAGLLLCLVSAIQPSYKLIKFAGPFLDGLPERVNALVDEIFPEELEIKFQNGLASSNVTEPYFLTVSRRGLSGLLNMDYKGEPNSKLRLLTINTQGKLEDFENFQSLAMLTSKNLIYYSDGDTKIQSLGSIPDMTVNKQLIKDKIREIDPQGKLTDSLKKILYFSPLLIILGYLILYFIDVFSYAILVWIINKILITNISFGKIFGFTGALYFIPTLFLTLLNFIPSFAIFYSWISVALDVLILSLAYLFISGYKSQTKTP